MPSTMREQLEGSQAMARAIAHCRPEVVCAYPITPQTHIVEEVSRIARAGKLGSCEVINVESEFAAMSVAIGSSATGARTYTATASQGLLYMCEALFNASGLGLPIVMTVANRALGAPINIWNDQTDSMSMRDSGWLQLYAVDNQEAADLHVQAFKIAEQLSLPVMVCVDGFILTHSMEPVAVPSAEDVDAFLPAFEPRQVLDPDDVMTIGAMVGPEAFTEVRYLSHVKQIEALDVIPRVAAEFGELFGRPAGGLLDGYHSDDAETLVLALGSVNGTLVEVIDDLREEGVKVGSVALKAFRPFPFAEVRTALAGAKRLIVLERAFSVGIGGIVASDVAAALHGLEIETHTVIAGLGGRAVTRRSLRAMIEQAIAGKLEALHFLDLRMDVVERELTRDVAGRRPGPHAEAILRDLGIIAVEQL